MLKLLGSKVRGSQDKQLREDISQDLQAVKKEMLAKSLIG